MKFLIQKLAVLPNGCASPCASRSTNELEEFLSGYSKIGLSESENTDDAPALQIRCFSLEYAMPLSVFTSGRLTLVGLIGAVSLLPLQARAEASACAAAATFEHGTAVLPTIKVYTGADGASHIERTEIRGFTVPFFSGGVLNETVLGPSLKVVLVHGPPNGTIPVRAGIGRVMFLTLEGSSTVVLPSGEEATASPGELIIFDDASSKSGHGGRTGPCGYTALSIGLPDGAPDSPIQH